MHVQHECPQIKDFYSKQYSDYKADFICCRHVLEHIEQDAETLTTLRRLLKKNGKIFVTELEQAIRIRTGEVGSEAV